MDQALNILRRVFGYEAFRHHQAEIIETLLDGGDAFVLMPTGGGKSLCYQIPAMVRPGVGVVVSPLVALMHDQVTALKLLGVRAACLNSTQDRETQRAIEAQAKRGELDLLYVAPERLLTDNALALLDETPLALFAIDEAHCVSQWGHDFRPEYRQLSVLHQRFPDVPRLALTATADRRTRAEIVEQLDLKNARTFVNSFDRPNIHYAITDGQNARERLWRFLVNEHPDDAGIVYCLSRKKVETVAEWLTAKGREALPYHAGLPAEIRERHQSRFLREEGLIIVATIAFGMGIDKPDVRFVAHLNLPKSIEAYYQETGRAGRDGEPADAWLAYGLQDVITLRQMTLQGEGDALHKRVAHQKLEAMLGLCELITCRRQALLAYFDETLDAPCGNCDNCRNPPETWDATEPARKALSCVYRTGQRFGVNYVIDVLTGKADERIRRNGHDRLSTFGIGTDLKATAWRALFRQLIALGYLETDAEGYGALHLTEKCRPLLRGEVTGLRLRRMQKRVKADIRPMDSEVSELSAEEKALYDELRRHRNALAEAQGVPPYVIFANSTLRGMARRRPLDREAMARISGVGEKKLERYGDEFIDLIREYEAPIT